jgi:hypothetical protein
LEEEFAADKDIGPNGPLRLVAHPADKETFFWMIPPNTLQWWMEEKSTIGPQIPIWPRMLLNAFI